VPVSPMAQVFFLHGPAQPLADAICRQITGLTRRAYLLMRNNYLT
jgi:hypothetical protein